MSLESFSVAVEESIASTGGLVDSGVPVDIEEPASVNEPPTEETPFGSASVDEVATGPAAAQKRKMEADELGTEPSDPASIPVVAAVKESELSNNETLEKSKKLKQSDLAELSIRQYLGLTVVPHLNKGLTSLARERPDNPLDYIGNYLLECSKKENASGE